MVIYEFGGTQVCFTVLRDWFWLCAQRLLQVLIIGQYVILEGKPELAEFKANTLTSVLSFQTFNSVNLCLLMLMDPNNMQVRWYQCNQNLSLLVDYISGSLFSLFTKKIGFPNFNSMLNNR